jgi:formylmethanofuran dehydrogenase subunit D
MASKRFIMNAGRTTKQGQQINIGKDHPEYETLVSTLTMNPDDMK